MRYVDVAVLERRSVGFVGRSWRPPWKYWIKVWEKILDSNISRGSIPGGVVFTHGYVTSRHGTYPTRLDQPWQLISRYVHTVYSFAALIMYWILCCDQTNDFFHSLCASFILIIFISAFKKTHYEINRIVLFIYRFLWTRKTKASTMVATVLSILW